MATQPIRSFEVQGKAIHPGNEHKAPILLDVEQVILRQPITLPEIEGLGFSVGCKLFEITSGIWGLGFGWFSLFSLCRVEGFGVSKL